MILSIVYCGRQNIALRGNVESTKDEENNPDNFLALQISGIKPANTMQMTCHHPTEVFFVELFHWRRQWLNADQEIHSSAV